MQLPLPATLAIETAFNAVLQLDATARARLSALQGKVIELHLQGLDLRVYFLIHADKVEVLRFFDGEIDATISGTPLSMASLSVNNRALFAGEVEISGDIETGQKFNRLLESIEVDWEEHLSTITGDIVAHNIGNVVRNTNAWLDRTAQSLSEDLGDYLREESLLTPTHGECEKLYKTIDTLRDDVERLRARIERLEPTQGTK
ncbi:MAG: SCP2 sterol-binding domain-containing protein [Pseudomonadota bacterium]